MLQVLECWQKHMLVMGLGCCSIPWLCLPLSCCLCPHPISALISCSHLISHVLILLLMPSSCYSCPHLIAHVLVLVLIPIVHCVMFIASLWSWVQLVVEDCILYHPSIDKVKCNIQFQTASVPVISYFVWPTSINIFIEHSANLERWSCCLTHHIFKRYFTMQT